MNSIIWKTRISCKVCFMKLFSKNTVLFGDKAYNSVLYFIVFGRKGDFQTPKSLNEYIIHRKLFANEEGFEKYTDKYEVRRYISERLGDGYLNEVIGVYDTPDDIPFDELPESFVLKGTHGSGYNIIVSDKTKYSKGKIVKSFRKWFKCNYYYFGRERNYRNIVPRVVCERYLRTDDGVPLNEVKLWCFNGKVKLIADTRIEDGERKINLYNRNKDFLEVFMGANHHKLSLPNCIDEMVRIAETVSDRFEFVRVDLYEVSGKIIFSELTFHPGGGFVPFEPDEYDYKFASFFGVEK